MTEEKKLSYGDIKDMSDSNDENAQYLTEAERIWMDYNNEVLSRIELTEKIIDYKIALLNTQAAAKALEVKLNQKELIDLKSKNEATKSKQLEKYAELKSKYGLDKYKRWGHDPLSGKIVVSSADLKEDEVEPTEEG